MGEVHNTASQNTGKKSSWLSGITPFLVGLVVALLFGWLVYPSIMYSKEKQPIAFNHQVHLEDAGMACVDCHYLRADGSFNGRPTTESCATCHSVAMGSSKEEARFIAEYVDAGKEIKDDWLVYQKQPDNVFFSHSAHSMETCAKCHTYVYPIKTEADLCKTCHIDMSTVTTPPVYSENWLSGYSKDTMMMWECEECHAIPGHRFGQANASNACFVCHK